MRRIGDLIPGIATSLGLDAPLELASAMHAWERVVASVVPPAAGQSRVLEIRPPAIVVTAPDAMTGQELRLRAPELLAVYAAAPGGARLRELRVVVRAERTPGGGTGGRGRPV
jgi:hypothetical protein